MCRKVFKSIGKEEHVVVNRFLLHPIKFYCSRPKKEAVSCIYIIPILFSSILLLIFFSRWSRARFFLFSHSFETYSLWIVFCLPKRDTDSLGHMQRISYCKKRCTKEKNIEHKYIGTQKKHWNENMYFYHLSLSWLEDTKACNVGFLRSWALQT